MEDLTTIDVPQSHPRNAFKAAVFSLVFPGLGQVYNGQIKKGILYFALSYLIPVIFAVTRWATSFAGMVIFLTIAISFLLFMVVDAIINAKRQKFYILKPYNKWYNYVLIAIFISTTTLVFDIKKMIGIQSYIAQTTANNPTILEGDWIITDTKAYEKNTPKIGDLVTFTKEDGQLFMYRIVGLPKDTISLKDNIVSINNKLSKSKFIADRNIEGINFSELEETFPNGHSHRIYKSKEEFDDGMMNMNDFVVPTDSIFVLGDSRDHALDSRYIGCIAKNQITGQIKYSYWGKTGFKRINIKF
ncbi:signal peptidase I [Sphingobacterium siyangense]|uniref:signal peptidase I n=1 Tax=Sphingobacterium siyangense TaxID=459529 RepID=UPI00200D2C4E|nr:signal peptidase I [Sphingobacterium siyangense]UQA76634.1 signal peptidase I [Sphingobacterium siyangense]